MITPQLNGGNGFWTLICLWDLCSSLYTASILSQAVMVDLKSVIWLPMIYFGGLPRSFLLLLSAAWYGISMVWKFCSLCDISVSDLIQMHVKMLPVFSVGVIHLSFYPGYACLLLSSVTESTWALKAGKHSFSYILM